MTDKKCSDIVITAENIDKILYKTDNVQRSSPYFTTVQKDETGEKQDETGEIYIYRNKRVR